MNHTLRHPRKLIHEPLLQVQPSDKLPFTLAEEVPVAMVFNGASMADFMATPLNIEDFAFGFAFTEGFIKTTDDVDSFEVVSHTSGIEARFWLKDTQSKALTVRRRKTIGPIGCGLCGIDSLEEANRQIPNLEHVQLSLDENIGRQVFRQLRDFQPLHSLTKSMHCSAFITQHQGIVCAREDVGRHNALDKLIGALIRENIDPAKGAFLMSSRISVELIQKSAMAGCSTILATSLPTGYSVRLAESAGMTLAKVSDAREIEIFTHSMRIKMPSGNSPSEAN